MLISNLTFGTTQKQSSTELVYVLSSYIYRTSELLKRVSTIQL